MARIFYTPALTVTGNITFDGGTDLVTDLAAKIPKSLGTTKGDIIGFSGSGVPVRLPVGTAGQILSVDTGEALSLKWIAAGAGDFVGPGSATDGDIVQFDGVTGKLGKDGVGFGTANGDAILLTANGLPAISGEDLTHIQTVAKGGTGASSAGDARTNLGLGVASQTAVGGLTMNLDLIQKLGVDVASANALALGDGNLFDITGTTTILGINTKGVGTIVFLQFDGILTITHHATDLILPGGDNITTVAGDIGIFYEYATGDWRCINWTSAGGGTSGSNVQVVNVQDGAVATGTTAIPLDDTIPQITEGDEYMTLAITPKSATNKLLIEAIVYGAHSASGGGLQSTLFQDATANALASAICGRDQGNNTIGGVILRHYMTAGTTSSTTFRIRAGTDDGATFTLNGNLGGRLDGGVRYSSITITEIKA